MDLQDQLQSIPETRSCARIAPIEALADAEGAAAPADVTWFKATVSDPGQRRRQSADIYPTYGRYLDGGFLSHIAGKMFLRTGLDDVTVKIHNIEQGERKNPGQWRLEGTELGHFHAADFDRWIGRFRFRHSQGAYRSELRPNRPRPQGGMTRHEFFNVLLEDGGEDSLREFFDDVCRATPALRARLERHGLLRRHALGLEAKLAKHFPDLA